MSDETHRFERTYPNGWSLFAWVEYDEEEATHLLKIQWRGPDGKPNHTPLYLDLYGAEDHFDALKHFAGNVKRELTSERINGKSDA